MTKTEETICKLLVCIQKKRDIHYGKDEPFDVLGVNSVEFIELIVKLEETFHIEFEDEMLQLDKIRTIQMIGNYIDATLMRK